jgi:hypothetical protein
MGLCEVVIVDVDVKLCVYVHCMDEQLGEMGKVRGT